MNCKQPNYIQIFTLSLQKHVQRGCFLHRKTLSQSHTSKWFSNRLQTIGGVHTYPCSPLFRWFKLPTCSTYPILPTLQSCIDFGNYFVGREFSFCHKRADRLVVACASQCLDCRMSSLKLAFLQLVDQPATLASCAVHTCILVVCRAYSTTNIYILNAC